MERIILNVKGQEVELTDRQYDMITSAIALGIETAADSVSPVYTSEDGIELEELLPKIS